MQPQPFLPWMWREESWLLPGRDRFDDDLTPEHDPPEDGPEPSFVGYTVEALDGSIGSIDKTSTQVGTCCLVVDTGPWIFGRKVLLPAGVVQHVDHTDRTVYVDRTKQQIKDSPPYDPETFNSPQYREQVGDYYTDTYRDSS